MILNSVRTSLCLNTYQLAFDARGATDYALYSNGTAEPEEERMNDVNFSTRVAGRGRI